MSGNCFPKYANCAAANMDPSAFSEAYFEVNHIKGERLFDFLTRSRTKLIFRTIAVFSV